MIFLLQHPLLTIVFKLRKDFRKIADPKGILKEFGYFHFQLGWDWEKFIFLPIVMQIH